MVRILVEAGTPAVEAIRMATLNPAEHFGLHQRGAIAPGRRADFMVVDSLQELFADDVYVAGKLAARGGRATDWDIPSPPAPPPPSMRVDPDRIDLRIPARQGKVRVIRAVPDQIVTGMEILEPTLSWNGVVADPSRDLLKIAVVERHRGSGRVGLGLVTGVGLREGAIAGTVAHDHHNIVAIGADDDSIRAAVSVVVEMGGGLVAIRGSEPLASLPLPVGGLMSLEPIEVVREDLEAVVSAARTMGSPLHDPFMAMSFLALEVIPSLKITDQGLVDVDRFQPVALWVADEEASS
jgi:adenine deaminase